MTAPPLPTSSALRPMEIGLFLSTGETSDGACITSWADLVAVAMRAEDLGFDSVWVGDHLKVGLGPDIDDFGMWEGWSMLSALAAATDRIEIGTLVASTPYRSPALLAKMAETVDEISGGRLILGVGAGWHEPEFKAFGFPFDHRASRFEEAIQITTRLLRGETVTFNGSYYHIEECELRPRRPRPNGIPILIGTRGPRMMRVAARYADAWDTDFIGNPTDLSSLRTKLAGIDAACVAVGRDPSTLQKTASVMVNLPGPATTSDHPQASWRRETQPISGSPEEIASVFQEYAAEGISRLHVWLEPNTAEGVEGFAPVLEFLDQGQETAATMC